MALLPNLKKRKNVNATPISNRLLTTTVLYPVNPIKEPVALVLQYYRTAKRTQLLLSRRLFGSPDYEYQAREGITALPATRTTTVITAQLASRRHVGSPDPINVSPAKA